MNKKLVASLVLTAVAGWAFAQSAPTATKPGFAPTTKAISAEHAKRATDLVDKGVAFLLKARNEDGGWGMKPGESHPAITALAVKALVGAGYKYDSPEVAAALKSMVKGRQSDGGIYVASEGNDNYTTCVAVMALAATGDPQYKSQLADAVKYLRGIQIVEGGKTPTGEEVTKDHPFAGGVSYGKHGRPDLSNEGYWMEAMNAAGVAGDDPAMQRALAFVKRVQNRTEGTEGQSFVVKGDDDGGFIYAIDKKDGKFVGESMAGDSDRGLRSYGSMTYTGFKSMLYANVGKNDPRVKAAFDWIRKNWRLDANPNTPDKTSRQGLFYYYQVFAKALRTFGQDVIESPLSNGSGVKHNWREELIDVLAKQQKPDGSWVNDSEARWMEGNPVLATVFALQALEDASK